MPTFDFLPLVWWGLPLVAVPLVIHLINLLRHRRVEWAAMEFLLASRKKYRTRVLLRQWLDEAIAAGCMEPTGMALSTVTAEGRPRVRMVLCKGVSEEGIRFFTNYESAKAVELEASGFAAVAFWWDKLARQIRVEGSVERLPRAEMTEPVPVTRMSL